MSEELRSQLPLARPDSEVDAEVARDGVSCLRTLKMPDAVKVMQRGGDMAKELAEKPGAIGMTTTTVAEQSAGKIKPLSLDGIEPTEANVTDGKYRLTREVFLVTRETASAGVKSFLAFVKSADGSRVIKENGAIAKARP
jgi:phosphate transport system substrate-binding protein